MNEITKITDTPTPIPGENAQVENQADLCIDGSKIEFKLGDEGIEIKANSQGLKTLANYFKLMADLPPDSPLTHMHFDLDDPIIREAGVTLTGDTGMIISLKKE